MRRKNKSKDYKFIPICQVKMSMKLEIWLKSIYASQNPTILHS